MRTGEGYDSIMGFLGIKLAFRGSKGDQLVLGIEETGSTWHDVYIQHDTHVFVPFLLLRGWL